MDELYGTDYKYWVSDWLDGKQLSSIILHYNTQTICVNDFVFS